MSILNQQISSTNLAKRSFLKTVTFSFVFIAFGGLGSLIKSFIFERSEKNPKTGFGSNGYGQ